MVAEYHNQSKLRFWCQMVLPLVYDDSLSYMELLNKVVNYLNNCIQDVGNCETNIELLLDAFESLQDYVNEMVEDISPEIESVIDQMIENGDFTEILTDALNTVVAPEYDEETTYLQYEYVLYEGNLYRANTTTSGEFDPTKWTEKTIAQDLTVLERYVYGLTANDIPYDGTQTYDAGSTGKAIKDLAAEVDSLDAGDIAYNSSTTYNNATVGKELGDLKGAINSLGDNGIWLCVGDSFLVENPGNTSWAMCIATYLGKTYGTDVVISAKSGSGFSHPSDNIKFLDLVNSASISEANRPKVSKVIFGGGTNDIFTATQTDLETDIPTAVKRAKQLFPNAKVYVADTECWINSTYTYATRASLYEHYQNGCAMGGGLFLGAVGIGCKLNPSTMLGNDKQHPVLAGQQDIAKRILLAMSGIPYRGTKTARTGNFWTFERNDIITVTWYSNYTYNLPEAIASLTPDGGNGIQIALNDFVVPETNSNDIGFFTGNITANGVIIACSIRIRPISTGFEVFPYIVNSNGTFTALTNVTRIQILAGQGLDITAHCIG